VRKSPLLRRADRGGAAPSRERHTRLPDIRRKLGISEATFTLGVSGFGKLGTPEIRELRQLREENARLKRLVAEF